MKFKHIFTVFALAFAFSFFTASSVYASDYSFNLSPTIIETDLDPGDTYEGSFYVTNTGEKDLELVPVAMSYDVSDYTYEVIASSSSKYSEISEWITFSTNKYSLKSGEGASVNFTINVPSNAHGGSQHTYVGLRTDSGAGNGIVKASHEMMIILDANISGNIIMSGELQSVDFTSGLLAFGGPISADVTVKNSGNITFRPSSHLTVKNLLSGKNIYDNSDNLTSVNILPESTRTYSVEWSEVPMFGVFSLTLTTDLLGTSNTSEQLIIVCPVWALVALFIIILAIIILISIKVKKSQAKNHSRFSH